MQDTNPPVVYPKCRCEEGKDSDWEQTNETCIGIRPIIRKSVVVILLILAATCFYDAISTIIYIEDESFFWGTLIAAFVFTFLAYYILSVYTIKEITIRCKKCQFETIVYSKSK